MPWFVLGDYPSPVRLLPLHGAAVPVYQKREDLSSPLYGGNKVRTIEGHIGRAVALGREQIWATGAWGSNHALATAVHAPRAGLRVGAALVEQPPSLPAHANLRALAATGATVTDAIGWLGRPLAALQLLRDPKQVVMTPGGAVPIGSLGHVSAALELMTQVEAGLLPAPAHVVVTVGSTATTAGLLVGFALAAGLGIGSARAPRLHAVRVAPWPVTSHAAITWLARRTLAQLERLLGRTLPVERRALAAALEVDGAQNGRGYGYPTESGDHAKRAFAAAGSTPLDTVYTARSGAGLLALLPRAEGPVVHWMTKSSAPLAEPSEAQLAALPPKLRAWLRRAPMDSDSSRRERGP
ncbi:MAG: pyridoxal-phosphate dependent enzyme [Deltaproteobacteria bacterium]|nr:pyridoxal-phosphate dependent enzyme [Deltaproteobacteria bacterium]